jgi:hypothetical protein
VTGVLFGLLGISVLITIVLFFLGPSDARRPGDKQWTEDDW